MAQTIFDASDRQQLVARLSQLRADSQRTFGKMSCPQMVCHLQDSLDVATGVRPAKPKGPAIMANPLMRRIIIYWLPWPKARAQTAPEMLVTQPSNWNADIANLKQKLVAAAERGPAAAWPPHPAFGKLSGKDYGALIFKHFNHHLKQFGV